MLSVAAGVLVIAGGTAGLLSTHGTAAHPPTVPTPTTSIVRLATASPSTPVSKGVLKSSYAPPQPSGAEGQVPLPAELIIPKIGVNATIIDLGLESNGSLNVGPLDHQPEASDEAGWYTGSVRPGQIGPAVIAGHINYSGPGVFEYLTDLRVGDLIYVKRFGGSIVEFRVTMVQTKLKTDFPTGGVFDPTPDAELRLISCTGTYNRATHHYNSNVIVYAQEVS